MTRPELEKARPQNVVDPRCYVEMLGGLQVNRGEECITRFARQKARALLAYLALHPRLHPREHLVDLFWPDQDLPEGRDSLSTALGSLRRPLEPPGVRKGEVLLTASDQVGLNFSVVTTDVAAFERLLEQAAQSQEPASRITLLEQAAALYRGDLLPGFYQDWAILEMNRLQGRCHSALRQLAQDREALGDLERALAITQRLSATDPYSEETHCRLIRLQILTGHLGTAREAHRQFERLFEEEYGTPPSSETRQVVESLFAEPPTPSPSSPAPTHAIVVSPTLSSPQPTKSDPRTSHVAAPIALSAFFGRENEIAQLVQMLLPTKEPPTGPDWPDPAYRLVTLIGPGGIGKTRLTLEFIRQVGERFQIRCTFVSLAELTTPNQIAGRIAAALKLTPNAGTDPIEQVIAFFQEQDRPDAPPVLLVLDNLEHLLAAETGSEEAAGIVQTLLERSPGLSLLCTSRRRLGVRGERLVEIAPLETPEQPESLLEPEALAQLAQTPSVRLYVDRAQAVRPDFGLTPTNAPAVAALCRQLEGSPLALELAAAWVRTLPPRKMWERLTAGLDIPAGSYADLPERHRSLGAALDWSFRLLDPNLQRLFVRLSVFQGGWTAEAAEAVCSNFQLAISNFQLQPTPAPTENRKSKIENFDALSALAQLQEASLVRVTETEEGEVRYGFLETIRAFSRTRLAANGERKAAQCRHAHYFRDLVQEAASHLRGPEQAMWLARLETENENLRTALTWYFSPLSEEGDREEMESGLKMAVALVRFWIVRGHWSEGRQWLETALARIGDSCPAALKAYALNGAGSLANSQGDYAQARAQYEESLAILKTVGDTSSIARLLHNLGYLAMKQGDPVRAQPLYEESLALERQMGDAEGIATALHHLGWVAHEQGDLVRAQALYEESLTLRRPLGNQNGIAHTLHNLANIAVSQGDFHRARTLNEESLAIRRDLGDPSGTASSLINLGDVALAQGDDAQAQGFYEEGLTLQREMDDSPGMTQALIRMAAVALSRQHVHRAVRLAGAATNLSAALGSPFPANELENLLIPAKTMLGEEAFAAAWAAGERMTMEQAVAYAMEEAVGE